MFLFLIFLVVLATYNPPIMSLNLSNYVLLCGFILSLFIKKQRIYEIRQNLFNISICAFFIWVLISNVFSIDHYVTFRSSLKILSLFLFAFFLRLIIKNKKDDCMLWNYIIFANIVSCIVGLYQFVFQTSTYHLAYGTDFDALRIVGAFPTPNIYANFLCLTLPIIILKAIEEKRIVWFAMLAINGIVLYETFSRGTVISLGVAVVLWKMIDCALISKTMRLTRKRIRYITIISLILVATIINLISSGKLTFLFQTRGSTSERVNSLLAALEIFVENPIGQGFGVGIGSVLDGTYINILVDLGFIGIVLFLIILVNMILRSVKMCQINNCIYTQSVLLTIITMALLCVFESVVYDSLINFFFAIIWFELNLPNVIRNDFKKLQPLNTIMN